MYHHKNEVLFLTGTLHIIRHRERKMKKPLFITYSVLTLLFMKAQPLSAELTTHVDTLLFDEGIMLTASPSTITPDWNSSSVCSERIDFFYRNVEMCCLALGCNCGLRFGSSGDLYRSTGTFADADFSNALDVSGALFTPASREDDLVCPEFKSFSEPSSTGPIPKNNFEPFFFIVKNADMKHALLRIRYIPITYPEDPSMPIMTDARNERDRIEVTWYLQSDGTTDFSHLGIMNNRATGHTAPVMPKAFGMSTYTLKGEIVPGRHRIGKGVYIAAAGRERQCRVMLRTDH